MGGTNPNFSGRSRSSVFERAAMNAQLLSSDNNSHRASGKLKTVVALSAVIGFLIGAMVALPLSAPAAAEPLNLAATPLANQKLAPLQRLPISTVPRAQLRGPVQVRSNSPDAPADELKFLAKE